jgi:hemerythrin
MSLLDWKDDYALGIGSVDYEHRELIELINRLYGEAAGGAAAERVEAFLGEIYAAIAAHFALEETLMRDRGYDQYRQHKADHERLLDEILDILDAYTAGTLIDADTLASRLDTWFTKHFKTHDARLHRFLPEA